MSATPFPYTRNRYYNPVSKIQSLIQNLDAELVELCKQCSVPKPTSANSSITMYPSMRMNQTAATSNGHSHSMPAGGSHFSARSLGSGSRVDNMSLALSRSRATAASSASGTQHLASPDMHKRQLRNIYRTRVIDAYRNRRIFTVYGNYHTIRRALMRRGWLEKLPPGRFAKLQALPEETLLEHARRGNDYEAVAISKMINHFPSFFIWQTKAQRDLCAEVLPYRNRVRRTQCMDFSTKVGLVGCAEQELWFREDGICGMSYPRFYRLGSNSFEERMAFIDDYQHTQARSLLYYLKEQTPAQLIDPAQGTIATTVLDFALQKVKNMIREMEHCSLDDTRTKHQTPAELVENQTFMVNSTELLKGRAKVRATEKAITEYARLATQYLAEIERARPDFTWDGCRNLWILKPGFQSRGIGIVIRSGLDDILQWSTSNQNRRYIVQKYIERPLLIYKTKFDIRQYMLLSISDVKITIWLYRDCYLRFSSQEFTMDDLRESIHLTNNSVQKRYKNKQTRDQRLPKHNMWSLDQFKCHLRHVGASDDTWKRIYNGFKQNLVAVVLASMDETELVQNAFELYGCDFMLDEQYNPILIEINSTPDLSPSTEVTARICPMVLKDVIRVVVDLPKNATASTGLFERAYEVNYQLHSSQKATSSLELNGTAVKLHEQVKKTPIRAKLFKRITNTLTKTINTSPVRKEAPVAATKEKAHGKRKLKERLKKVKAPHANPSANSPEHSRVQISGSQSRVKLNSKAKENLALQYAKVK